MASQKHRGENSFSGKVLASRVYPEFFSIRDGDTVLFAGCGRGEQVVSYGQAGKKLFGVDVQEGRITEAHTRVTVAGIGNFEGVVANLELLPFPDKFFDKVIAVDVIQHVRNPEQALSELYRVLKSNGELLITIPALQHYLLTALLHWRYLHLRGSAHLERGLRVSAHQWNPDAFNHNWPLSEWLHLLLGAGFRVARSHATTLFPPLHRWGVPRFWFSNEFVHRMDWFLGGLPVLKRFGQAFMCVCRKRDT